MPTFIILKVHLKGDWTMFFDLNKAFDKSKLVQVQVTVNGKNGTFTRMQWKKPSDVKSTDVVVNQQDSTDKTNKLIKL